MSGLRRKASRQLAFANARFRLIVLKNNVFLVLERSRQLAELHRDVVLVGPGYVAGNLASGETS